MASLTPLLRKSRSAPLFLALVAALLSACQTSKGTVLAPTDSLITLSASTELLPVNTTALITVTVKRADGSPAEDGTEVVLTATLGQLDRSKVRIQNGTASLLFHAGAQTGTARIQASSAEARGSLDLSIISEAVGRVTLTASPSSLPPSGGQTDLAATVAAADGSPIAGVPVSFQSTAGSLTPPSPVRTDELGVAKTRLSTSSDAVVTARVENTRSADVHITLRSGVSLSIRTTPQEPVAGQVTTFSITHSDPSVSGKVSVVFGDGEMADLGPPRAQMSTEHTYKSAGGYNATAVFTPASGDEIRDTIRVEVKAGDGSTFDLTVTVSPAQPEEGGSTTFTIVPSNSSAPGSLSISFGDGDSEDLGTLKPTLKVTHVYEHAGGYNATVTFKPAAGDELRYTTRVEVLTRSDSPPPPPDPPPDPPSGEDEIDISEVKWLHADVSDWDVTSRITDVDIMDPGVCIEHTKAGKWPVLGGGEGNPWVLARIDGRWYAGTYEWLRPGQTCKDVSADDIGPHTKKEPLESWKPKSGELVGFMVSTLARDSRRTSNERSNIVLKRWP